MNRLSFAAAAVFLTLVPLRADVLLRYKSVVTMNETLPQQFRDTALQAMSAGSLKDSVQRFKGGKAAYISGLQTSIQDSATGEVTLIDAEQQRYARAPVDQFLEETARAMPAVPAQATAAMASIKGHSEVSATGRSETILGIEAEEHQIVVTIDGPPLPNIPPGPFLRIVLHIWTAKPGEEARVPALGELSRFKANALETFDPVATMTRMLRQMPGVADALGGMMKDRASLGGGIMLRTQIEIFMPMLATLMKQTVTGGGNPFGTAFDPNSVVVQMTQELTEMSTDPIPEAAMQVPEGFRSVPMGEVLRDMIASAAAKKPAQ